MTKYQTKALDAKTWAAFARLVEANNGVWGGCWCMWYHGKDKSADDAPALKRNAKECLVREGRAHASLVFDGTDCVGWCQFGSPEELPRIHNQRAYLATNPTLPDWRITCFFSGSGYRGNGVASAALKGAVEQIKNEAAGALRDTRKTPKVEGPRQHFCLMEPCRHSNVSASSGHGSSESTSGW